MIKVCHVSTMNNWGGVERLLIDTLITVDQRNVEHFLMTTSSTPEILKPIKEAGVEVFQPKRLFHYDPTMLLQMARWMRSRKIDIVHTYNINSNCWGGIAARLAGVPIRVAGEHGSAWLQKSALTQLEDRLYATSNLVIANSFASEIVLSVKRKLSVDKIKVIHNAIKVPDSYKSPSDEVLRREFGLCAHDKVIGTICRLTASKDLFTWLDTAKILADTRDDVCFVIVGDGPLATPLKKYAEELGISHQVVFTGWRRDARDLLHEFDVYVSSSIKESFGITLLEAAFCKKAVVATRVDGIPEIVVAGKTGLLVTPNVEIHERLLRQEVNLVSEVVIDGKLESPKSVSAVEMAKRVNLLLDDSDYCQNLGRRAYHRVKDRFSIEQYVRHLHSTYFALSGRTTT